jgi:hypothetical protein
LSVWIVENYIDTKREYPKAYSTKELALRRVSEILEGQMHSCEDENTWTYGTYFEHFVTIYDVEIDEI